MELRLVKSCFCGGEGGAGTAGVKSQPDLLSFVVDVGGRVEGVSGLICNDVLP